MRLPIKLNRNRWPRTIGKLLPSTTDPRTLCGGAATDVEFTKAISILKFGSTFKTTQKARFPQTIAALAQLDFPSPPVVLDVGASDGTTSLDVMQSVRFGKYFVTDLNIEVFFDTTNATTWFFDCNGLCILAATDKWVVYPDTDGAIFPLGGLSRKIMARAPKYNEDMRRIVLINPKLRAQAETGVVIRKHDILKVWPLEKANLILVANILNRVYFSDEVIGQALDNLTGALEDGGRIVIIDNRPQEKSSIFRFVQGAVTVEKRINGGTEIEALALQFFSEQKRSGKTWDTNAA